MPDLTHLRPMPAVSIRALGREVSPDFWFLSVLALGAINLVPFGMVIVMTIVTAPDFAAMPHRTEALRLKRILGCLPSLVAPNRLRKAPKW